MRGRGPSPGKMLRTTTDGWRRLLVSEQEKLRAMTDERARLRNALRRAPFGIESEEYDRWFMDVCQPALNAGYVEAARVMGGKAA